MKIYRLLLTLLLAWFVGESVGQAHPGHTHRRESSSTSASSATGRKWAAVDADQSIAGTFVMARDGVVQIRREDDSLKTIPLEQLNPDDRRYVELRMQQVREAVDGPVLLAQGTQQRTRPKETKPAAVPLIASHFDPFVKLQAIRTRWDGDYFYVESNGIPAHPMMIGIRSWQQQVPIPQKYVGENAWQIPLKPVPAQTPAMADERFLRGAIAIAVNGIPIFNPLNNRGDDAYQFGELDDFGGHCGRADDYHYHIAPVHLEETVGKGQPIAYALDGYPVYGYQSEQDPDYAPLDKLNGHKDAKGQYHYHATKTYPYLNGGFYGEVVEKDGQVDPQPRAEPLRPSLPPMKGAKITGFEETGKGSYRLTYDLSGKSGTVSYTLTENGSARFVFVDPSGETTEETYTPRRRGPGGPPPRKDGQPPRKDDKAPPPGDRPRRKEDGPQPRQQTEERRKSDFPQLSVSSSSVDDDGMLSIDCTCDGKRQSPAVEWQDAPEGTNAFAVSLWHNAPDQEKSYWLVYNIPVDTTSIAQNAKPDGTVGLNDRRRAEFDPMCSKGPGIKTYHITVFALSQKVDLRPDQASRSDLLEVIQGKILAEGTLDFQYERTGK
ncbi:MAG: YHYH protein [Planctomycetaceae bacterium]